MLGFSAFSETPYAQSVSSIPALVFASSSFTQGYVGLIDYDAKAVFHAPSVSADVIYNAFGSINAKATTAVTDVIASLDVIDVLEFHAKANVTPSGTTSVFGSSTLGYDAKANLSLGSVTSDIYVQPLSDVDAQAAANLSSASAYLTIYITDFADETGQAKAFMPPAEAVSSVDIDYDAKANTFSNSVDANSAISKLDYTAKANITTGGIDLTLFAGNLDYVDAKVRTRLGSLQANITANVVDPATSNFPYYMYADAYSRSRTVYVVSYNNNKTAHVVRQTNTVHITGTDSRNVVYITPER